MTRPYAWICAGRDKWIARTPRNILVAIVERRRDGKGWTASLVLSGERATYPGPKQARDAIDERIAS